MTTGNERQEDIDAYKNLRERVMKMCRDKQYSKAVLPAEDLYAMCRNSFGESRSATVNTTIDLGMIYAQLNDRARAELLFRQALGTAQGRWGTDDQKYLRSLKMLKQVAGEQALENQTKDRLEELQKKVDRDAIAVECPICDKTYATTPKLAGKEVFCQECELEFTAGGQAQSPVRQEAAKPVEARPRVAKEGKMHAGSAYPYTFRMPKGWVRHYEYREKDVVIEHSELGVFMTVVSDWNLEPGDLNFQFMEEAYAGEVQGYRRIGMSETTVAGIPAYYLEYENDLYEEGGSERKRSLACAFLKDGKLFQLISVTSLEALERAGEETQSAVETFSFDEEEVARVRWQEVLDVFRGGIKWGIAGAIAGLVIGLVIATSAAFNNIAKIQLTLFAIVAFGFIGLISGWGQFGCKASGRWEVIREKVKKFEGFLPFYYLLTPVNVAIASFISSVFVGVPYMLFVVIRRRVQIGYWTYRLLEASWIIILIIIGGLTSLA